MGLTHLSFGAFSQILLNSLFAKSVTVKAAIMASVPHPSFDRNFTAIINKYAIKAIHICAFTALTLVPTYFFTCNCPFKTLKKSSTFHRAFYKSQAVIALSELCSVNCPNKSATNWPQQESRLTPLSPLCSSTPI